MILLEVPPGAWPMPPWEVLGGILAGAAARATQAERRYDEQLSDHSIRLHHLEAASRKETPS